MKRWLFLALAVVTVIGIGALLLRTRQAPDITQDSEEIPVLNETLAPPPPVSDLAASRPRLSTEEFRQIGAEVMKSLPTKNDLQNLDAAQAHGTPPPILTAGLALGKLAEAIGDDPALEAEAVTLYRECAASPQYPDSVRALCFSNYKRLTRKTGAAFNQYVVNKALRQLAEKLEF